MSQTWSTNIQGINTLNLNRQIRFTDKTFGQITQAIGIKDGDEILELGCGPGTFTKRLADFYPEANITGLDFDQNFVDYCKEHAEDKKLRYVRGNALETPFENESFNVCTSHTVIEHLPNEVFLKEQFRLLKPGGKTVVMNVRAEKALRSDIALEPSKREDELMDKISQVLQVIQDKNKVAEHAANPQEILRTMEGIGYVDLELNVIPYVVCIDDIRNTMEYKKLVLDSQKLMQIEFIEMALNKKSDVLSKVDLDELYTLIEERFEDRIKMINNGENIWDLSIVPNVMIIGKKPV